METSRSSEGESGGRMDGRRLASIDLPAPGGPIINRLWPPAAATSSARLAVSWPLMSARSGSVSLGSAMPASGRERTWVPRKWLAMAIRLRGLRIAMSPLAQAASGPEAAGQMSPRPSRIGGDRRRQHAGDRRDGAVQRQFAQRHEIAELVAGHRADRRHQGERDGQVVMAAFLGEIGGREIDDDALGRQRQAGGMQGAAHPFAALGHRLVGQADDDEARQAGHDLHLDIDGNRLDALKGHGGDVRDHAPAPTAARRSLAEAATGRQEQYVNAVVGALTRPRRSAPSARRDGQAAGSAGTPPAPRRVPAPS